MADEIHTHVTGVAQGQFGIVHGNSSVQVTGGGRVDSNPSPDLIEQLAALRACLEEHRGELSPEDAQDAERDLDKADAEASKLPPDTGAGPGLSRALNRLRVTVEGVDLLVKAVDRVLATLRHLGVG